MIVSNWVSIGLVLGLSACGGAGTMMGTVDNQGFAQSMDNARAEEGLHHENIFDAGSMDDIRVEMARHERTMAVTAADMRIRIGHMPAGCGAVATTRDAMLGMMDAIDSLESTHQSAIGAAATLDEARAECDRHAAASGRMLDEIQQGWEGMPCM